MLTKQLVEGTKSRTGVVSADNFSFFILILFVATFFVYDDFDIPVIAGFALLGFTVALVLLQKGGRLKLMSVQIAFLVLAAFISVCFLLPYSTFSKFFLLVVVFLDISALFAIVSAPQKIDKPLNVLLIVCTIISLYSCLVFAFPNLYWNGVSPLLSSEAARKVSRSLREGYGVGIGGSVALLDYYAFLGLTISLNKMFWRCFERKTKWFNVFAAAVCFFAVVITNRKGELIATVLTVVILLLNKSSFPDRKTRRKVIKAALVGLAAAVGMVFLLGGQSILTRYSSFIQRLLTSTDLNSLSTGRMVLWEKAWNLFKENPVFGIGWQSFSTYLSSTYSVMNDGQLNNVHNNYLQILCETGLLGFALIVGMMIFILVKTWKQARWLVKNQIKDRTYGMAASISLSIQIYSFLVSFVDPLWYKISFWPIYAIAVILATYSMRPQNTLEKQRTSFCECDRIK